MGVSKNNIKWRQQKWQQCWWLDDECDDGDTMISSWPEESYSRCFHLILSRRLSCPPPRRQHIGYRMCWLKLSTSDISSWCHRGSVCLRLFPRSWRQTLAQENCNLPRSTKNPVMTFTQPSLTHSLCVWIFHWWSPCSFHLGLLFDT